MKENRDSGSESWRESASNAGEKKSKKRKDQNFYRILYHLERRDRLSFRPPLSQWYQNRKTSTEYQKADF